MINGQKYELLIYLLGIYNMFEHAINFNINDIETQYNVERYK